MESQLVAIVAAVLLVGCGQSQPSAPPSESKPAEPVAEASQPEPPTDKAPDISIHEVAKTGNIEAVKQALAAGVDVNAKDEGGWTPLYVAKNKEFTELLIENGANVNAKDKDGLHTARLGHPAQPPRNRRPPPQTRRQKLARIES